MPYVVIIPHHVDRQLQALPSANYPSVRAAIRLLGQNPRPPSCTRLVGQAGWRIRIGTYRVVYDIDDSAQTVTITAVGHRRDIYR